MSDSRIALFEKTHPSLEGFISWFSMIICTVSLSHLNNICGAWICATKFWKGVRWPLSISSINQVLKIIDLQNIALFLFFCIKKKMGLDSLVNPFSFFCRVSRALPLLFRTKQHFHNHAYTRILQLIYLLRNISWFSAENCFITWLFYVNLIPYLSKHNTQYAGVIKLVKPCVTAETH